MPPNISLRTRFLLVGVLVYCVALAAVVAVEVYLLNSGRAELTRGIIIVGAVALALTAVYAIGSYAWLTRSLRRMSAASARLAAGELTVRVPAEGNDDIGKLGAAFNAMAEALSSRIKALAQGEAKFTAIADYSYDCELWADPSGKLIWINPTVKDMFGYTPEECLAAQDFPVPFVREPDVTCTVRQIRLAVLGNTGQDYEFRARRKDGATFWAAADWRPIFDTNNSNLGIRISIRDITTRKEAEQQLEATVKELRDAQAVQKQYLAQAQDEHARLSALLGAMDIGILYVSMDNHAVYCNPAFSRIWMIPPGTRIIGADLVQMLITSGNTLARPSEHERYLLQPPLPGEPNSVFELPTADGSLVTQQSHAMEDAFGKPVGRMWIFEDVATERRNADQLVYLAERDALTGLNNRHRFNDEMGRMVAEAQRSSSRVALLFFDLDEFKYINDTFRHCAGDAMLIRVASEVGGQVRRNEIFARLGGDEFAILVRDISDEMLKILAERITRSIAQVRFQFEGQNLRLTCSCGIAVYPDHAGRVHPGGREIGKDRRYRSLGARPLDQNVVRGERDPRAGGEYLRAFARRSHAAVVYRQRVAPPRRTRAAIAGGVDGNFGSVRTARRTQIHRSVAADRLRRMPG